MDVNGVGGAVTPLTQSEQSKARVDEELDTFLKLLTTQMENQDPTEPMDTNQMFQQFATLTMVEQSINANANLEKLVDLSKQSSGMVSYLGQEVTAEGNLGVLSDGEARFAYHMPTDATEATISITNQTGRVVYSGPAEITAGDHRFVWDGNDNQGLPMPNGLYRVTVTAKGETEDDVIEPTTYTVGIVDGVSFSGDEPSVYVGDIEIPASDIISVRIPAAPPAPEGEQAA